MQLLIKKYNKYKLQLNRKKVYVYESSQGNNNPDDWYIIMLCEEMQIDDVIERSQNDRTGCENDSVSLKIVLQNGIKFVEIINMNEVDLDQSFDEYMPHYILRLDDFQTIVKNYKRSLERNLPYFYLISLSNNRVIWQAELTDAHFTFPKKWLEYVKIAYLKDDSCYDKVEKTSPELDWFFGLHFRLNSHDRIFEHYEKYSENRPKDMSSQDVKEMLEKWERLKTKEDPVYFVKNDAGAIEVRKSILSLRHVLLARSQDGSYGIKDECGIGVFDFLEEFALGFSPERFLQEHEDADSEDEFYAIHGHVEIICSKDKNFILLNLGKAPYEFEYIERDRARYFERTEVEMPLYEFVAKMIYWVALKEKQSPEIYFTQQDDGALVIQEY